jgi:hypothetical protein
VATSGLLPELIDDRAVETADEDRLSYGDFVDELESVVVTARTPANIALYGAWGSGKTGLANLLGSRLASQPGVRYARFDAFKYAETPLRRQFLSQVAASLKIDDKDFHEDLYRETNRVELRIPRLDLLKLIGVFLLVLAIVELMALLVIALIAAKAEGPFSKSFSEFLNAGLALAFAPAALLAAFVSLAGKTLPVERKRTAPSSDEEFERIFRNLVRRTGAERLVIFIDELDRCSASEVVTTLETVRTFLDVEPCVFIVAADQQVLERALRQKARQSTPADPTNPYYSAGSEYLDKIFHYQIALPPLLPRRLTGYALELTENRSGVWQRIDREEVVSILIPTHVTSPRRVKTLLNSYVLAFRLAERRAREGVLASSIEQRTAELAKLVCLRCEFPLFAADLPLDARLPDLVREFADDPDTAAPGQMSPRVVERARLYADGQLPTDELLVTAEEANE